MDNTNAIRLGRHRPFYPTPKQATKKPIYVLVSVCSETNQICRVNTAPHTIAGREALEKQAARLPGRAYVQTEWEAR